MNLLYMICPNKPDNNNKWTYPVVCFYINLELVRVRQVNLTLVITCSQGGIIPIILDIDIWLVVWQCGQAPNGDMTMAGLLQAGVATRDQFIVIYTSANTNISFLLFP